MSRKLCAVPILLVFAPAVFAQVQLQFLSPATYSAAVSLKNGDSLLIGSAATMNFLLDAVHTQIALAATGPVPFPQVAPFPVIGGSGNDVPYAAAVDPSGNLWIAGTTDSDDFNLVNPIVSKKVPYRTAGFVLELDPTGTKLLFATYLAGQTPNPPCAVCGFSTIATAIAIDPKGNVYVGGATTEADFPTTPGVYMTTAPTAGEDEFFDTFYYAFAAKISPAGKLLYSTFLGTGPATCTNPTCLGNESTFVSITSLAADATGVLTVAAVQNGDTPALISRLSTDATSFTPLPSFAIPGTIGPMRIAEDASGNLNIFGTYNAQGGLITPGLFAAKLSSNGTVIYSTDLGSSADAGVAGIVLDSSGNAYLAGTSSSAQFPTLAGVPALGPGFVLRLNATGTAAQTLFRFPSGTIALAPAFDGNGNLLLASRSGWLLTLSPAYDFKTPAIVGAINSASFVPLPDLAPGQLISLLGFGLSNAQVSIGGVAASVLYSGANQINVQVPFDGVGTQIQAAAAGGTVSVGGLPAGQQNGFFSGPSLGLFSVALNQDGTVNSASNPATQGSIVTLYGTGAIWPAGIADGAVATSAMPLNQELNKFEMLDANETPLSILYEGAAPGLMYGVFQLNVQLPIGVSPPLTLEAFTDLAVLTVQASNSVQVYVK